MSCWTTGREPTSGSSNQLTTSTQRTMPLGDLIPNRIRRTAIHRQPHAAVVCGKTLPRAADATLQPVVRRGMSSSPKNDSTRSERALTELWRHSDDVTF